ncbi:ABC transporter ATP-binding protein [Polyangium sorediatum]|uniref:ABC transporter ATP-binding protein n=1 Tax=Polyangium sorediatum TaxID=889274 RepID=A0ABT6NYD4_9BACT|nr:ABC transporter ATP-binding protein [Polyangium sorediatum]MDI1433308.1 ABC transporter ATP-binding protein [Polyangium sorediatum]
MSDAAPPPVLHAEDARITIDDVVAIDRLTVRARGDRVLCTGEAEALFAALTAVPLRSRAPSHDDAAMPGEASLAAGTLHVAGFDVATRAHLDAAGIAPLDPPLPKGTTAHDYVTWSARLAGFSPRAARDLAASALERVGLSAFLRRTVDTLELPTRRALVLAHALVADPPVLVLEAPLAGLDGPGAAFVMNALARATDGRGALLSAERLDPGTPEGDLARGATDVLVFAGGALVLEGAPETLFAGVRVYGVTIRKNPGPFREELLARGIEVTGGPLRMSVRLSAAASTKDIVAAASKARAPLVEMFPIVG